MLFAAMAALLVTALCVPGAFADLGLTLALAYGAVRAGHITLFLLASRSDPGLRHSVVGLAASTSIGVAILVAGARLDGDARLAVWATALVLDMAGPLFIDTRGWRFVAEHFAERHGLIMIVALGESIVAIGVGAEAGVDAGVVAAAVLIAVSCAFWWAYFDAAATAAGRWLAEIEPVQARNELAATRTPSCTWPWWGAVVLVALGMKDTLASVGDPLRTETAAALVGGAALYLLAHVAFKLRALAALSGHRMVGAFLLAAFLLVAPRVDALVTITVVAAVLWAVLAVESVQRRDDRRRIRGAASGAGA